MSIPPLDEHAGTLAAIGVGLAALWKIWLRVRHDHREDKSEVRGDHAEAQMVSGYAAIIEQLREEVRRLTKSNDSLIEQLQEEREMRRVLANRVYDLENRLRVLGQNTGGPGK